MGDNQEEGLKWLSPLSMDKARTDKPRICSSNLLQNLG